jgi:uncharacterized membrane protein YcjF (UPF0283 family)
LHGAVDATRSLPPQRQLQFKSDNPIIQYAWQDFDPLRKSDALREQRLKTKIAFLNTLYDKAGYVLPSFSNLSRSELMGKTLWSTPDWIAYCDTVIHAPGQSE